MSWACYGSRHGQTLHWPYVIKLAWWPSWNRESNPDMGHKSALHKHRDVSNEPKVRHAVTNQSPPRANTAPSGGHVLESTWNPPPPRGWVLTLVFPLHTQPSAPALTTWEVLSPQGGFFKKSDIKWKPPTSHHHSCLNHRSAKAPPSGIKFNRSLLPRTKLWAVIPRKQYLSWTGLGRDRQQGLQPPLRLLLLWNDTLHIPHDLQSSEMEAIHGLRAVYTVLGKQYWARGHVLRERPLSHLRQMLFPRKAPNSELYPLWALRACCLSSSGKNRGVCRLTVWAACVSLWNVMCFYLISR